MIDMIMTQSPSSPPPNSSISLQEDWIKPVKGYCELGSGFEFTLNDMTTFVLDESTAIRLNSPLKMRITEDVVEVLDWSLHHSVPELVNIDQHVKRHFLKLLGKAERGELSDSEHTAWITIVDATDYQRFCSDRARPFYTEGVFRKKNDKGDILVEWQDGEEEWVPSRMTGALGCLEDGDVFSAFIKRNHRNQTIRLESVAFLGERDVVYAEISEDWPPVLRVAEEHSS